MRGSVTFTILLACLFSATVTFAATPIQEVIRPQGLLILGGFQQWLSLSSEYSSHDSSLPRASSSVYRFKEKYHIALNGAILDPHLFFLSLDGEVGLEQSQATSDARGDQSTHGAQYQYNLAGSLFDQSTLPITFLSSRELRTVVTAYSQPFTSDTFVNGVTAVFHHKLTPLLFRYWRISTDISGLAADYTTTSNNFSLQAEHDIPDLSHSRFNGSISQQDLEIQGQPSISSSNYSLALTNSINLDRRKKYTLSSSLQGSESRAGEIPQQSLHWLETLNCRFGKALWGFLDYRYSYDKTLGFDSQEQITKYNEVTGSLTHRLFTSLDTAITGRYRSGETLGGDETIYGGSASATYRKKLPADSTIQLTVKEEYEITDRLISGGLLAVRDEEHRGVGLGDNITLAVSGNFLLVVSVKSRNPEITYVEGLHYTVDPAAGRVIIPNFPVAGGVQPGTDLFISYSVQPNPMTKYSTTTFNSSLNLSLFKNLFTILGNYNSQERTTISNRSDTIDLYNSRSAMIHLDANFYPNSLSAEYGLYVSGPTNYTYWEGGWRFDYRFNRQSLTFKARDRYLIREITAAGAPPRESWENTAEFGTTYSRPLFNWANVSAALNYVNTTGQDIKQEYAYFKLDLQGRVNKLFINLIGQSILRIRPSETTRDDYVLLEVKRYF